MKGMACNAKGGTVAVRYIERGKLRNATFGLEPTGKTYELVAMEFLILKMARFKGAGESGMQHHRLGSWGLPSEVKA